jgi:hypothetical protein
MAMEVIVVSGAGSAGKSDVDANFAQKVNAPTDMTKSGYLVLAGERDPGSLTGTASRAALVVSEEGRLQVGQDTLLFHHMFTATSQNTAVWKHTFTTMTMVQSGGFLVSNNNLTATTTTGCALQSWRYFPLVDRCDTMLTIGVAITSAAMANQVLEFGLFVPTVTTAPTEGVYLRYTSAGWVGVVNYNGTETTTGVLGAITTVGTVYDYQFLIGEGDVEFYQAGILMGSVSCPAGNSNIFQNEALPIGIQQRNSGAVVGTQMQAKFSCISAFQNDINVQKPWAVQMAANGYAYQATEGNTMGQTALWVNNTAPTAVVLTNTTATFVGLGGIAAILPTLAANSDGIVFSYQNPQGSTTIPARTLTIQGIHLQGAVSVVLAGGPVTYAYALTFGSTNVSQATAESASFVTATAKAPRRIPIGMETYAVTAAAGTLGGTGIHIEFITPIVVNPGEFVQLIARNIGTVTTTGAITLVATLDHYLE